ncbi:Hydrogen peroxidase [Caenispirillum salinarum AK4]|uniref:Hydrogen peroxidase n=1 Tax=Caenispirillum salinarum AK4 TaxID=1238182 RepID=K9HWW5_9PROT|nr:LysR substrate-binding domain-containing protein [Caenispirillum salinarum]EKV32636.1 Hydrogen peroxidase [Caenispirillum salinarum AK4]
MSLRRYLYLRALARERHFGRAAAACHVSQPTLSNAIRQLEADLGVPIVERGQTFQGFTPEGLTVLDHARRILALQEALEQDLAQRQGGLMAPLRLGAIPTALPVVAHLVEAFSARHPAAPVRVLSLSSRAIERGLAAFELDAAITYLENEPLADVRMVPLYSERYHLLGRRAVLGEAVVGRGQATWAEAAAHPLCLLTPDMQNRRIVDAAFRMADRSVAPALETNSVINLLTNARLGPYASVVPGPLLTVLPADESVVALPLVAPDVAQVVGLVHPDRDPAPPVARALARAVAEAGVPRAIARALAA